MCSFLFASELRVSSPLLFLKICLTQCSLTGLKGKLFDFRKVWRYQKGNQKYWRTDKVKKDTRSTKHYTENQTSSNTNHTKNQGWTQIPRKIGSSCSICGTRRVTLVLFWIDKKMYKMSLRGHITTRKSMSLHWLTRTCSMFGAISDVGSLTNGIHLSSNTGNGDLNWDIISGFHISDIAKYQSIDYIYGVYLLASYN
jgi:hypothetical protein